ncbi:hypothetical protein N7468_002895 [Penicillium chermesinum]|uniref:Tse2 ADP-ribosyltransferase toxin domain-containing protein n=1 Tax=Penicillium chermesinum TaxID=63820 RepID=A0A9W9P5G8_9EURO|nr:uncharacterized protein N7468_002895 [Penicillium chermesinum]KAJ5238276.1 hypothetical protein N7468_002895 [Penicillium chermesinum]KAJ6163937.1 hypothetical protein N7470_002609 [Penicillium chermesinum]
MSTNRFIQSFTHVPKELFRLNTGAAVRLRAQPGPVRPQRSFDLLTAAGKVQPKALDPASYEWPNGASMRPNSAGQQNLVRTFRGSTIYVYAVPAGSFPPILKSLVQNLSEHFIGTTLPDDLILVHEFGDHYSLQARKEMTVEGNIVL